MSPWTNRIATEFPNRERARAPRALTCPAEVPSLPLPSGAPSFQPEWQHERRLDWVEDSARELEDDR